MSDARCFGRVAVLMGGTSSERDVSLDSGRNVLDALRRRGVDAEPVDGIPALVSALAGQRFDRVFNILHGQHGGGEDGVVQGLLESFGVPYTGSGVLGSALSMDKVRTKQVWTALNLPTPRYVTLSAAEDGSSAARTLGFPLIVKPACEGSSVGVSRVYTEAELEAALALARRYPGELLVEQLIEGDELTVAILGEEALPSIRIVPAAGAYYDYHAKYVADTTQYVCPGLEGPAEQELGATALRAFRAAGCSGWGRVDVMRNRMGANFLLEVNTSPGMTSHSLVPKAARAVGLDFDELVWRILETSCSGTAATGSGAA
jgi:D-alanine-D-alanine ligase